VEEAEATFEKMKSAGSPPGVVCYGAMASAYAKAYDSGSGECYV